MHENQRYFGLPGLQKTRAGSIMKNKVLPVNPGEGNAGFVELIKK